MKPSFLAVEHFKCHPWAFDFLPIICDDDGGDLVFFSNTMGVAMDVVAERFRPRYLFHDASIGIHTVERDVFCGACGPVGS